MQVHGIVHSPCMDGLASAWVIKRRWPNAIIHHCAYDDPVPELSGMVIIADFSYPPDTLQAICDMTDVSGVMLLDHHQTAIDRLKAFSHDKLVTRFSTQFAGCILTWDALFPSEEPPVLLHYIQDRDLWQHRLLDTKEINAALDLNVKSLEDLDRMMHLDRRHLLRDGEVVIRVWDSMIERIAQDASQIEFDGRMATICNAPAIFRSELGNHLVQTTGIPLAIVWCELKNGTFKYSLRGDGTVDCAKIAESYGGGGHHNAASFVLDDPL